MTKEKLEKEAEELIQRVEMGNSMNCFMQLTPDRKQIGEMLVMIAEPREKRIAELEAQIEKMKCCGNCKHFDFNEPNYCHKGVYRERQYVCSEWEFGN